MTDRPPPERAGAAGRVIRCPGCGGDSIYAAGNPYRPFCSARCRGADLGTWASEGYRVPATPSPEDDADDAMPRPDDA